MPLEQQFMPCLERILAREAGVAPLATVNILMSLCQLQRLPFRALQFVFSPSFMNHINGMHTEWPLGLWAVGQGHSRVSAPSVPQSLLPYRHPSFSDCATLPLSTRHGCAA